MTPALALFLGKLYYVTMSDPYQMVAVNIAASLLLIVCLLFYRFIYPKKKINLVILLLLISILPILSIFRTGDYESGDFNIHIYRIMSFYDSLKEGIYMPSWAGELNATYGNPLFIFNYSLPYYVISFFHFIGISFIDAMKAYLGSTLYLSGIFMYLWIKELLKNKLAAFTAAIFYIFSPYHLIDVHFRATLGESTIFMLLPLLFLFITKYFNSKKIIYLIWTILLTDLLFLAHPLVATIFFVIAVLYILFINFKNKNFKSAIPQLLSLFAGAIASVYVWISFILYSPYMLKIPASPLNSTVSFVFFEHLFLSPWRYGFLFQGHQGELAHLIGYTQIPVVLISIFLILFKKISKKIRADYIFWTSLCLFTFLAMTPISSYFWKYVNDLMPMLVVFGRLSLAISFFTSIIAGYFIVTVSKNRKSKIFTYVLLVITIGYTILNWEHRRVIPEINDNTLRKNVWSSTIAEGTTAYFLSTKWTNIENLWFSEKPKAPLEIMQGSGTIKEISRTSTRHRYTVYAQTPITVKENTLYFPGWSLRNNYKRVPIYPNEKGVIIAKLPKGIQYLDLTYEDIGPYKIAKTISITAFFILIILLISLSLPKTKRSSLIR